MTAPAARLTSALADRYRLERELGEGGMATVYLAQDLKHDRKVAVKVLRPELAAVIGAERFLSEIKTTANLQHPHILPLFDSGEADSFLFYVMPFVEGESLRDRLNREKQLPIADAVRIASEVAAALDYAHRQGVIHRDIKPENILLHDGAALVADFGIALAASKAGGTRMTETGMSLGTPHYMSPEQAMGERDITARSDVYALGAMTYEMLVGDPPFIGGTAQAVVAKVLTEKPSPPSQARDTVPEEIDDAVLTALAKLPADRYASAAEFAAALAGQRSSGAVMRRGRGAVGSSSRSVSRRSTAIWSALLLLATSIAAWSWLANPWGAPEPTIRFGVGMLGSANVSYPAANQLAISPNGEVIAFARRNDRGVRQLFSRRLDELESRAIPGTEGGTQPFFSPDGEWVAFLAERQIRKVPLAGGQPTVVTDLPGLFFGACWGPGGQIVVSRGNRLMMVSADGGTLAPLSPDDTTTSRLFYYPRILPDGKTVIVTRWDGSAVTAELWIAAIGKGEPQDLNLPGSYPLGYLDGHLLFAMKGGVLMAVPFDLGKGRTTGTPVRVLEGVSVIVSGAAEAALSPGGSLVYNAGAPLKQLVEVDLRGATMAAIPDQRVYLYPRYSPDGTRIAVAVESQSGFDIWLYERGSRTLSRLTTEGTLNDRPEWSPDASQILFRSNRDGDLALWTQPADGRGTPQMAVQGQEGKVWEGVFTPDGRSIIYRTGTVGTADIWIRSLAGDTTPRPLVASPFTEWAPTPSPDGRWLAYESDESGDFQVYVIPLQGSGGRRQISVDGGSEPEWSRDGTRIFYRRFESRVMATITTDPELAVVRRDSLFSGDFASWFGHSSFDVSLDGQRLLMIAPANDSAETIVVHNWGPELRTRLRGRARSEQARD